MPKSLVSAGPSHKGFTLIELMVVISIIAILTTIGLVTYTNAQVSVRDSRRKQDLKQLQAALELYKQANGQYPCASSGGVISSAPSPWLTDTLGCGNATTVSFNSTYISSIPIDPTNNLSYPTANFDTSSGYAYFYNTPGVTSGSGNTCPTLPAGATTGNNQYYVLKAHLENTNDPDRCKVKQYLRCDGVKWCDPATATSAQNQMYIITSQSGR